MDIKDQTKNSSALNISVFSLLFYIPANESNSFLRLRVEILHRKWHKTIHVGINKEDTLDLHSDS